MDELLSALHEMVDEMRTLPPPQPQSSRQSRASRPKLAATALDDQQVQAYLGAVHSDVLGLGAKRAPTERDSEG